MNVNEVYEHKMVVEHHNGFVPERLTYVIAVATKLDSEEVWRLFMPALVNPSIWKIVEFNVYRKYT